MLTKKQKSMMVKAFQMLRTGLDEAARAVDSGTPEDVLTHVRAMDKLTTMMVLGLEGHINAEPLLVHIAEKRPKVAAKTGRPKLSLVKG